MLFIVIYLVFNNLNTLKSLCKSNNTHEVVLIRKYVIFSFDLISKTLKYNVYYTYYSQDCYTIKHTSTIRF